ncbi:MAG: nucleotide sugar dehydrogenase [Candidatus Baltobacteraceae bacterium]
MTIAQQNASDGLSSANGRTELRSHFDVVVVGGFGHVGLPLAVSLAGQGKQVCALDINAEVRETILQGKVPFKEDGCEAVLSAALAADTFHTSLDIEVVGRADVVIVVIGTPVDRHLNPEFEPVWGLLKSLAPHFVDGQLLVLRSTVYPGTTDRLQKELKALGKNVDVAFCPERIAEGKAMEELVALPQLIGSEKPDVLARCRELFAPLTADVVELSPLEAELAKLFTNTWRYTLFATANQFYMLANDHGADFYRIHHAMTHNYPRAASMPKPGFAAGPCLFKDAMQLAAFNNNRFYLGHAAMLVNEGLPNYLIDRLKLHHDLSQMTVGVLGMAFKANSDDKRESLSYKVCKILAFESKAVLRSDVYIDEPGFVSADELIDRCDVIILGTPHAEYRDLKIPDSKIVVDIWNLWGGGCVL